MRNCTTVGSRALRVKIRAGLGHEPGRGSGIHNITNFHDMLLLAIRIRWHAGRILEIELDLFHGLGAMLWSMMATRWIQDTSELAQDAPAGAGGTRKGQALREAPPDLDAGSTESLWDLVFAGGSQAGVRASPQSAGRDEQGSGERGCDGHESAKTAPADHRPEPLAIASATGFPQLKERPTASARSCWVHSGCSRARLRRVARSAIQSTSIVASPRFFPSV